MSAILLFLSFLVASLAQSTGYWTANFVQNAVFSTGNGAVGVNTGVMRFNWGNKNFSIEYANSQWAEYYQYNSGAGETNADGQKLSTYGGTCTPTCGVSALATAMPPLGIAAGVPSGKWTKGSLVGAGCYLYTPIQNTVVANFTMTNAGVVCAVTLKDNRVFTLSSQVWNTAPTFNIPANCSCKGAADIWILVDHSASISDTEMSAFKNTFVKPFLDKLAISSTEINVGMSWFNLRTGLNFELTGDRGNINSGLNAWFTNCTAEKAQGRTPTGCQYAATATATAIMGYQPGNSNPSTPNSGTCTSFNTANSAGYNNNPTARIIGATEWFTVMASRKVPRLFITLTDGAMNKRLVPFGSNCADRNCAFDACNSGTSSGGIYDLTRAVNYLRTQTAADNPGQPLTLVSVGIGSYCTNDANNCLSNNHLLTLAGNNSANVLKIESFNADQLASAVNNLVLLSCPAENNQQTAQCIGTCCGLCVCGTCQKPATCATNPNICVKTTLGAFCCDATTVGVTNPCGTPTNQCNKTFCDANANGGQGLCTWSSVDCTNAAVGCEKRNCDPAAGTCTIPDRSACPPIPCTYGEWDTWTTCPVSCGTGSQTRSRQINRTAADGGAACPPNLANETRNCNTQCCPVACSWTVWGAFDTCTKTCGTGQQTRTRVKTPEVCGGTPCTGNPSETVNCNTQCCPVDCVWNNWGAYDTCTKTCGTGTQQRTRTKTDEVCGGNPCDGATSQTANCATNPCPVPCVGAWTQWQTFCPCNGVSATSTVYRFFSITTPASVTPPGTACPFADQFNQSRSCPDPQCAGGRIDCVGRNVTTPCTCANQFRTRTYYIDQIASGPGALPCPETAGLKENIPCNCTEGSVDNCQCPINCKSNFTEWGDCSCLTSQQNRTYIIYKNASFGGINCTYKQNQTLETQACIPICPVPCIGAFVPGPCNCTSKRFIERYTVSRPARDGGTPCPYSDGFQKTTACTTTQQNACPTPCVGAWTSWSVCNCDYGNQTRTFRVTKNATNGGTPCIRGNNTGAAQSCTPNAASCPKEPKCVSSTQCNDGNKCTQDLCTLQPSGISRCNWTQKVVCNDNSVCTADTCDPIKGCLFTANVFCNDNSVCTNESCHPIKGCQYTKKKCPDANVCFLGSCHPVQGCGTAARPCNKTDNCTESKCDVKYTTNGRTGPCYEDFICPFNFGLIAGISAGAAVAIAVAAGVVCLAVVGGGSYALASQMTQDDDTIITKNPMFQAKGVSGTNPCHLD